VLRVVTAFEQKRIATLREDTLAAACERIAVDMPHVVLALVPPRDETERDALADRAAAVGALVVHLDPAMDAASFNEILENTVRAAIERKLLREEAESKSIQGGSEPPSEEIDDGWGE
jgi:hypothetical protein